MDIALNASNALLKDAPCAITSISFTKSLSIMKTESFNARIHIQSQKAMIDDILKY